MLLVTAAAWAGPIIDGQNIPDEFGAGALLATQRFQTGFGDHQDDNQWGGGSELDQLFVTNDDAYLYVGLTGNLENNGNCIAVFIDVDEGATGANMLYTKVFGIPIDDLPRYLAGDEGGGPGLDNIEFDVGFAPNYVLGWSGGSPRGSETRTYYLVNWTTLAIGGDLFNHSNDVAGLIMTGYPAAFGPSGTLGGFLASASLGILGAGDNIGVDGVEGAPGPDPPGLAQNDPASQTTGFEFAIPLSELGVGIGDTVCLFALVSGSDGWISNQLLPPGETEEEFENIGNRNNGQDTLFFSDISGNQFACYTLVEPQEGCPEPGFAGKFCWADIDCDQHPCDCIVGLADLQKLLSNYGTTTGATHEDGDVEPAPNGDGDVDLGDLQELLSQYGDNCN
jgi:hypothetical protein